MIGLKTIAKTVFDTTPEEKARLDSVCEALRVTKIDFLRTAIAEAEQTLIGQEYHKEFPEGR